MDTVSPQAPVTALDVASPLSRSFVRPALLGGIALTIAVGLIGAVLWSQLATVRIDSDPPGANVFVDGNPAGVTPFMLRAFGAASWRVRVESPGYTPWTGDAYLRPREGGRLVAALVPMPGVLDLDSDPPGAAVTLDGEDAGVTPLVLSSVAAGAHTITLSVEDYTDRTLDLTLRAGATMKESIVLDPLPARLAITTSVDDASVFVDGELRGPTADEIAVAPGRRVVRVEAEGHRTWQRAIELAPNEQRALDVEMGASWVDATRDGAPSPLAIIVENEEHARPQTGLDRADIVYEALAEGGITRFLAIYASQGADVVGPVRSARDYFVEWAHEFNAPLIHIGASPTGYGAIASTGTRDLDETRGQPGFWRIGSRLAPHNAYTNVGDDRSALDWRGLVKRGYAGLQFAERPPKHTGESVTDATIRFLDPTYSAGWSYDPKANEYLREMNEEPHLDAESGEQIRATNVLLQWMDSWLIPGDQLGRLQFAQVGRGRLVALVDGVAVEGRWAKDSYDSPTRYTTADGKPLVLYPGPTWIEVVPLEGSVVMNGTNTPN